MNPINLLWNKLDHLKYWFIIRRFSQVETLMDIGCGEHPQDFIHVTDRHYTVDPVAIPDGNYFHTSGTWESAMNILRNNPVHTVVLMDVVEHIEKQEALCLLDETKDYVKQIVVFTPWGFMEQVDTENPWNTHKSGWIPQDFKGWEIYTFPDFHWCDFKGRIYEKPHGAILAIWRKQHD